MIDLIVVIELIRDKLNEDHDTAPKYQIIKDKLTPAELAFMEFTWAGGYIQACEDFGQISGSTRVKLIQERADILKQDLEKGGLKYD